MAGDWIKAEHVLPDKPEVIAIARLLAIDQDAVVGKLLRLWIWADQQTLTGNAPSVTESFIDRCTFATGFAAAMMKVGWLQQTDDGLSLPNFDRHNGQTAKERALMAKRVLKHRKRRNDPTVTESLPEKRREEKSKEEEGGKPPAPPKDSKRNPKPIEFPAVLQTPAFTEAWASWVKFRSEKRKPLTPSTIEAQVAKLAAWGSDRAVASIRQSIEHGWQGLFEVAGVLVAQQPDSKSEIARIAAQMEARRLEDERRRALIEAERASGGDLGIVERMRAKL